MKRGTLPAMPDAHEYYVQKNGMHMNQCEWDRQWRSCCRTIEFSVEAMDLYVCEILVEKLRLRVVSQLKACLDRAGAGKLKSGGRNSSPYFSLSLFLAKCLLLSRSQAFGNEWLYNVPISHASDANYCTKESMMFYDIGRGVT